MNNNGRNQTFMDTCQNGYKIRCARSNSPATAETSIYVAIALLAFVLINDYSNQWKFHLYTLNF